MQAGTGRTSPPGSAQRPPARQRSKPPPSSQSTRWVEALGELEADPGCVTPSHSSGLAAGHRRAGSAGVLQALGPEPPRRATGSGSRCRAPSCPRAIPLCPATSSWVGVSNLHPGLPLSSFPVYGLLGVTGSGLFLNPPWLSLRSLFASKNQK